MAGKLYYNTVSPDLLRTLKQLMKAKVFAPFRLVGGTSLSLQLGHRQSVDIDLFTDDVYNSINFDLLHSYLRKHYTYVDTNSFKTIGMGKAYFVGKSKDDCIKLDIFYTDAFIRKVNLIEGIRMATIEEIIAMKLDVISRGGRKKDFWDIHELSGKFSFSEMLALHKERYPFSHSKKEILSAFSNFKNADEDFDPICLKGKHWELIKLDLLEFLKT